MFRVWLADLTEMASRKHHDGSNMMWIKERVFDRLGRQLIWPEAFSYGPDHCKTWEIDLTLPINGIDMDFKGMGSTKAEAKEDACRQARQVLEPTSRADENYNQRARERTHELVGDKAADLLIVLRGFELGMTVGQIDTLRQSLLSNENLRQLAGPAGSAEESETRVGMRIAEEVTMRNLMDLLEGALSEANPALYSQLKSRLAAI